LKVRTSPRMRQRACFALAHYSSAAPSYRRLMIVHVLLESVSNHEYSNLHVVE
jgi:hypothetical protein